MTEDRRVVAVKPHSYLLTRAQMEEMVSQHKPDGSCWTPEEAARALFQPVVIAESSSPPG